MNDCQKESVSKTGYCVYVLKYFDGNKHRKLILESLFFSVHWFPLFQVSNERMIQEFNLTNERIDSLTESLMEQEKKGDQLYHFIHSQMLNTEPQDKVE